jgi:hypothetical protein
VSRTGIYSHSGAQRQEDFFAIGFTCEINESPGYSNSGAAKSPALGQFPSSILFRQNNICMSAALGSQYGATAEAAESLVAQLHSQGKLTTPRRENKKIRPEIEILKSKEPTPYV